MPNSVLDACAILAYLHAEPGGLVVAQLLNDPAVTCYAHSLNLCEVYYHEVRRSSEAFAKQVILRLRAAGVVESQDLDEAFWMRVGDLKSKVGIALPDCFALALAERVGGQVVTSDHKEFDPIVPLGICPILFIR